MMNPRRSLALALVSCLLIGGIALTGQPEPANGVEVYFTGSAQLDYLYIPTRERGRDLTLDGFTTELSLKVAADVTDSLHISVKTCYACHGFEIGNAYVDYRVHDAFHVRVGRFSPKFGDFQERHDPANHRTSDKPLPYDMGRMLRLREWNNGVLPVPYVDNGVELSGTVALAEDVVELNYAVYAIGGLRGDNNGVDLDFIQSRNSEIYYVDNNSVPAFGGRLSLRFELGDVGSLSLGGSAMWGKYDPDHELEYLIAGGDIVLIIERWKLRAEYLFRRTEMNPDDPAAVFRYGAGADGRFDPFQLKEGWYVETEYPVAKGVDILMRYDGLRRTGNVIFDSPLDDGSTVMRYTLGAAYGPIRYLRIKLSGEYYQFSDFGDEVGVHLGLVGTF